MTMSQITSFYYSQDICLQFFFAFVDYFNTPNMKKKTEEKVNFFIMGITCHFQTFKFLKNGLF